MIKIHYNEQTGEKLGFTSFGNSPEPFIEADITPEEYDNYKVLNGEIVAKTQGELDADAADSLALVKSSLRSEITSHRAELLAQGVEYNGYHFQADTLSRMNLKDMVDNADLLSYPFLWISYENVPVSFADADALGALSTAMKTFVSETFAGSFAAETAIDAAETEEAARAVVDAYKES